MNSNKKLPSGVAFILSTLFLFFFCFALNIASAQGEGLALDYTLTIDDPSNHTLLVKLEVENIRTPQLKLTRQAPYQTNPPILSMTVKSSLGSSIPYGIDRSVTNYETYVIYSAGASSITVEYNVDLEFFGQDVSSAHSYWNLDASYGAVESQLVFIQPVEDSVISSCEVRTNLPIERKLVSRFIERGDYYGVILMIK